MADQKVISRQTGVEDSQYKWGFELDIESDVAPKGNQRRGCAAPMRPV